MEILEWHPFFYNGIETNVEVTKCGRVRKVKTIFYGNHFNDKVGEIDFSKLKLSKGYKTLRFKIKGFSKGKTIYLHQLIAAAFLDHKFQGHKLVIDHIDSDKLNNNLNNLRVVSQRENSSKERTVKSGLPVGVFYRKDRNKYQSKIYFNNKRYHLGFFNNIEHASNAYQNKLKEITE